MLNSMGETREENGNLFFPNSSEPISINDLYPSTSGKTSLPANKFFPNEPDIEGAKGFYDSDTDMTKAGTSQQEVLWKDSMSEEPSLYGTAYKMLLDQKSHSKPSFHNDPFMTQTKDVYDNIDVIAQGFGDCTVENTFTNNKRPVQMPDYKSCGRVIEFSGDYNIKQEYTIGLIEYASGQPNYASCGDGCLDIWVGTLGRNYWAGSCTIYEEFTEFRVLNQDAIISATIDLAEFDDYFQVYFNNEMVWTHTPGVFPPETAGECERKTNWTATPDVDVTNIFKNGNENEILRFKTRTSVTGRGEGYARVRIMYDPAKTFKSTGWYPAKEKIAIDQIKDGFCKNYSFDCKYDGDNLDANGCIETNGVKICPKDVEELHPEINPFCRNLDIHAECDFYRGQIDCYTDPQGVTHCPYNDAENMIENPNDKTKLDSCEALEADPKCGFIRSKCIEGAQGKETNTCYAYNEVYDCGYSVGVSNVTKETEYMCTGEIRCMGGECLDIEQTQNGDFGKAAALLHATQHMGGDMQCDSAPAEAGSGNLDKCTVFKGEDRWCKKALGGTVDCCETPDNVNFGDYLTMITSVPKIDAAIMSIEKPLLSGVKSAYTYFREPIVSTFQQSTGPLTSYVESITGTYDAVVQGAEQMLNQLGAKVQEMMIEALKKIGFEGAGSGGVTAGAGEAVVGESAKGGLGSALGSVITFVGWVYLVYQIAMIIIQIIYECTEDELTLGVDRELKKCSYVGTYCASKILGMCAEIRDSYCCYPSPLGRIIVEQGTKQLGRDQGTAKAPQCDGLTIAEIDKIDWDQMDLSEWVGMLTEHDLFKDDTNVDIDSLTGAGTTLDIQGGNRLNALDRTLERFKDQNVDETRQKNANRFVAPTGAPK